MTLEEKIKKINIAPAASKLTALDSGTSVTIKEFWEKVVEPLLPDYNTMKKWHELLIEYVSFADAVFMIRKGNEESKSYMETVPADALRRGFLTKTDAGYWFAYNDNDFATYMLAMVLDGDIIDTLSAKELLTYLKTPDSIVRFNKSGKGGVEKNKAYFKINGTPPRISKNGYTVAHIFDVNAHYYDKELGFNNTGGEVALKSAMVNIDKGMYSDYTLKGTALSKNIYYRENYHPGSKARKYLEAHMLRFLHPLNYFCAPKDNNNGYVYCEFTDCVNNGKKNPRRFRRISGYEHLLYYAHYKFKEKYSDIYDDFLARIMLPDDTYDAFEHSVARPDYYADEVIDAQYANPLLSGSKSTASCSTKSAAKSTAPKAASAGTSVKNNNKVLVFKLLNDLVDNGKMTSSVILKLSDKRFTQQTFGIPSTYALLVKESDFTRLECNAKKYYKPERLVIDGEKYCVCSQWIPKRIKKLKDWHDIL